MSLGRRVRAPLRKVGISRSALVRRLAPVGDTRLRALRAGAMRGGAPLDRMLRAAIERVEGGELWVLHGHAEGLRFDLRHLTLAHAHLGGIAYGGLEAPVQEAMVRHLGPGGTMYDIGANLGFFSLLGARLVGPSGHVYAFEPASASARAVREHAALNGAAHITVIEKAPGAAAGYGRLQLVDDRSWSKLEAYGRHPGTERVVEVELVAIDDLLEAGELRAPTLVKIDVEGAELDVIAGMRRTIAQHRPAIVCELHGTHERIVSALDEVGYRVINLQGAEPIARDPAAAHALALPVRDPGD